MHRHFLKRIVLFSVACMTLSGCQRSFVPHGPVALAVGDSPGNDALYVQWLGVSSWIISRGDDVVVVDPFFTRPSFPSVVVSWLFPWLAANFGYDAERINDVLPDLPAQTRFVLLGHAHYDHLMDVPYYMKRKSGEDVTYVGSETARNILLGFKPAGFDFREAKDGTPIQKGRVRITAFPSDHAAHFLGYKIMAGDIKNPMTTFPVTAGEYVEGQTLVYFIDFLDEKDSVAWRIFINGAASSPAGAEALRKHKDFVRNHRTNIVILCVPGWNQVDDYPDGLLDLMNPENVVLSHYDNFGLPYQNGEDPKSGMSHVPFANYDGFVERLKNLQTGQRYAIQEPKTGQCLRFPAAERKLACEQ